MSDSRYSGVLFIGDPHLSSAILGFRKDDYPRVTLNKVKWCLEYARAERLLPALLGDLFEYPRDNANWLLGELFIHLSLQEVIGIHGNHDVHRNQLSDDDSISVLIKGGAVRMVDRENPWRGKISGRSVIIGGTSWGQYLPDSFSDDASELSPLVFWLTHHDVKVPGYETLGYLDPRELPGIDVVINGHIHRRLAEHQAGKTMWITPGNISRVKRGDASREHLPAALRVDVQANGWKHQWVAVPHAAFDEVFYPGVDVEASGDAAGSAFIQGLAELMARRTQTGAGLMEFLQNNIGAFEPDVAAEIISLAKEITIDGK